MGIRTLQSALPDLAPILDTVLDAVVVMDRFGMIIGWNGPAADTFGWPASSVFGRRLSDVIIPPALRDAHEAGMARLMGGGKPTVLNRRIEIEALRQTGEEFPVELSITSASHDGNPFFIGFLRDITLRKRAERALEREAHHARVMFELANSAGNAESFEDALAAGLKTICEMADWPVGHAFKVTASSPPALISTDIWFESEPGISTHLREVTDQIEWRERMGLPGTILSTGEPLWISDVIAEQNFYRKGCGFRGGFGFPLKSDGVVIAILEFFTVSPVEPDAGQLLIARALGEQVGRVFERRRRQDRETLLVNEINHRAKNLLAVVQAVAQQTFRSDQSKEVILQSFLGRMTALAQAHDLLIKSDMQDIGLREAIEAAIQGAGNSIDSFMLNGPPISVPAQRGTAVVLAIHELCTNAMKYGSLSIPTGTVQIEWASGSEDDSFQFAWRESGGPPVSPPLRQGFGSKLLARTIEAEFGGKIDFDFAPSGLICTFTIPSLFSKI